ncbi:Os07g0508375 [Oryza sativa Japonica Group]|uniref:Os07g0508375 protein n=2 Tax=Oryza sativa subsp. japonica TaxID=39947 RepID=Q8LIJ8_ORYSJ|nr:hypothetical protein [Oryza sativa Japonica Group]BAT01691.1 Os07g0508375 [Oryza sativa Japonica Group]
MGRGGGDGRDEELLPRRSDNLPSASFFHAREEAEPHDAAGGCGHRALLVSSTGVCSRSPPRSLPSCPASTHTLPPPPPGPPPPSTPPTTTAWIWWWTTSSSSLVTRIRRLAGGYKGKSTVDGRRRGGVDVSPLLPSPMLTPACLRSSPRGPAPLCSSDGSSDSNGGDRSSDFGVER